MDVKKKGNSWPRLFNPNILVWVDELAVNTLVYISSMVKSSTSILFVEFLSLGFQVEPGSYCLVDAQQNITWKAMRLYGSGYKG